MSIELTPVNNEEPNATPPPEQEPQASEDAPEVPESQAASVSSKPQRQIRK